MAAGILRRLTVLPEKAAAYSQETHFREAWQDLQTVGGQAALELAYRHAGVVLRPEAVATRSLNRCVELLRESDFEPVAARSFTFDRHMTRALWRYKLNIATLERLRVIDLLHTTGPSVLVIVHDAAASLDVPASVRLTALKGPSDPRQRRPGQIRARLGARNRLLNFIHTADEPADVVRELAIFFDWPERIEILCDALAARGALNDIAQELYACCPSHDLLLGRSLERVRQGAIEQARGDWARGRRDLLLRLCDLCSEGETPSNARWRELLGLVRASGLAVDRWDLATIGAHLVEPDLPGARLLGDASCDAWRERWAPDRSLR